MEGVLEVVELARKLGVTLERSGDSIRYFPKSETPPAFVTLLKERKAELLTYLASNGPVCPNPLTPHSLHELPWECDRNACTCYRYFKTPRWCPGAPCRWVWPDNAKDSRRQS